MYGESVHPVLPMDQTAIVFACRLAVHCAASAAHLTDSLYHFAGRSVYEYPVTGTKPNCSAPETAFLPDLPAGVAPEQVWGWQVAVFPVLKNLLPCLWACAHWPRLEAET